MCVIDGRTYLKGKSPFEGVWHDNYIPYDINEVFFQEQQFITNICYIQEFDDDEHVMSNCSKRCGMGEQYLYPSCTTLHITYIYIYNYLYTYIYI